MKLLHDFDCIVTIVNKGHTGPIIAASRQAGAEGGTILPARGTGIREAIKILGIAIEPEKEIILTLVQREISTRVLESMVEAGKLEKPGAGIAFILPVSAVAGICHLSTPA